MHLLGSQVKSVLRMLEPIAEYHKFAKIIFFFANREDKKSDYKHRWRIQIWEDVKNVKVLFKKIGPDPHFSFQNEHKCPNDWPSSSWLCLSLSNSWLIQNLSNRWSVGEAQLKAIKLGHCFVHTTDCITSIVSYRKWSKIWLALLSVFIHFTCASLTADLSAPKNQKCYYTLAASSCNQGRLTLDWYCLTVPLNEVDNLLYSVSLCRKCRDC